MKITVIHCAFEEGEAVKVAEVNVTHTTDVEEAMGYAYRYTNNVMGSWSRTDIEDNGDYNEDVTVLAPLHEGGMGLRSTSMGDHMWVDMEDGSAMQDIYEVAMVGFKKIGKIEPFGDKMIQSLTAQWGRINQGEVFGRNYQGKSPPITQT